uniref:peptidylprolyl isomerase n=1 Tax=Cryptomonas curvata TaxID=233186 RepID=A0A7S0MN72_9CRYP
MLSTDRLETVHSSCIRKSFVGLRASISEKEAAAPLSKPDRRLFGLALMNILLAPLISFTNDASAEERELPGRWAFRTRGSAFEAGFGDDFTQLESGLRLKDVKDGDGKEIVEGMSIKINFAGYILGDGKKFDSTWDKGRYVSFKVGGGAVIRGLDEGVRGMRIGGRRVLVILPQLGYRGKRLYGGAIPPAATLVLFVEPAEEGFGFGPLENPNAWKVGSLPEEPVAKPIECFNPNGCF